jgi:hypothetical protein
MSSVPLRPCPSCARHTRVSEPACPFCGHRFDDAFRTASSPPAPVRRLNRAALFALGAAGFVPGACSSSASSAYGAAPAAEEPDTGASTTPPLEDGDLSPCLVAGGQCSTGECAYSISASCGVSGESCCVQCETNEHRIAVSSYNQACTRDSDCVAIGVGDPCRRCDVLCPGNAAINIASYAQYRADLAASPAGADGATCSCVPATLTVCCNQGTCDPSCGADGSSGPIPILDADIDGAEIEDTGINDAEIEDTGINKLGPPD